MPWVTNADGTQSWVPDQPNAPLANPNPNQTPVTTPATVQVPSSPNIDPNASRTATPTTTDVGGPVQGPSSSVATPASSSGAIGAPQGVDASGNPNGKYTVEQILAPFDQEYAAASQAVIDANTRLNGRKDAKDAQGNPLPDQPPLDPLVDQQAYAAALQAYSAASTRLATANSNRAAALQTAIQKQEITPTQVDVATQQAKSYAASAAKTDAETKILTDGADSQKALVVAEGAKTANEGLLAAAQAQLAAAQARKVPSDIAQAQALTNYYQSQADDVTATRDAKVVNLNADTSLKGAQKDLTAVQGGYYQSLGTEATARAAYEDAQTAYQKALVPGAAALQAGQTAAQVGAGAQAQATAQSTLEAIKQKQQGALYGLPKQIDAIQQYVFNPANAQGKSIDELHAQANDLLGQLQENLQAGLAGTTPYAANVAAANYGQNIFGTQASLANAAQQAMATRASSLQGAGASALGTLAAMNANAPAGSTALGPAVAAAMHLFGSMANEFAPPPTAPTAPALPALLQKLAPAGASVPVGTGTLPAPGAAPPGVAIPSAAGSVPGNSNINPANGQPWPTFNPTTQAAPPTNAPVTINIGGGQSNAGPPAAQSYGASTAYTGGVAPWNAQPQPAMPAILSQHQPLSPQQAVDYWHQINGLTPPSQQPYQGASSGVPGLPGLPSGLTTPTPGAAYPTGAM